MAKIKRDAELPKASYWRARAQEARAKADSFADLEAKTTMRNVAALYDAMADRAEERELQSRR